MEGNSYRVYINPNFKLKSLENAVSLTTKNNMYVNPYFNQVAIQNNFDQNIKRKIFVNPNFIPTNYALDTRTSVTDLHYKPTLNTNTIINNNPWNLNTRNKQLSYQREKENSDITASPTVSKSRYKLVRKTDTHSENIDNVIKKNSTIKIGRYKTARLSYIKNNLTIKEDKKPVQKFPVTQMIKMPSQHKITKVTCIDKRKFIKINKINTESKIMFKKIVRNTRRTTLNPNLDDNFRTISGKFKKNNIPCPLFSKYGKCLRNINGNCGFVHDKKHVSICRKFLKGICHDSSCLFSHEISTKKMPTCHFYLNGNCKKDNCPYLHVKLNNKVKLCKEFLKGYCENGDHCTYRHVNKVIKSLIKHSMDLQRQYSCQSSAFIVSKKIKTKLTNKKIETRMTTASKSELYNIEKSDAKCRYFGQDDKEEQAVVCDVIKPSRCKLGTLPSFIKL